MAALTDLSVSFLSLVATPATGKGLTLKSVKPNERAGVFEISKTDDERMVAYGIVYSPDEEDSHGDTADADTIRKAAYEFMREARLKNIDTEHTFTTAMAYVAESWLVRKGDELFGDEPEGSWAVGIQIGDVDLWRKLKSGELTGISLAGIARATPDPDDVPDTHWVGKDDKPPSWVGRLLSALSKDNPQQNTIEENDMDKNEVQGIVTETLKAELPGVLAAALKTAGVAAPPPPNEPTEVEKAVAAALKAAGVEVKAPEGDPPDEGETEIEKAIAKAIGGFEAKFDDKITKALAKGALENDPGTGAGKEGFL